MKNKKETKSKTNIIILVPSGRGISSKSKILLQPRDTRVYPPRILRNNLVLPLVRSDRCVLSVRKVAGCVGLVVVGVEVREVVVGVGLRRVMVDVELW